MAHSNGKVTKPVRWLDTYKNALEMKEVAVSNLMLERIAKAIVEWAGHEKSLCVNEFYIAQGIPPSTWSKWLELSDELRDAYDIAKETIGIRREKGVMLGHYRDTMIKPLQGHYSVDWRNEQARQAHLQQSITNQQLQTKIVIMNDIERTDVVPPLVKPVDK
jgi:hypothetical protein